MTSANPDAAGESVATDLSTASTDERSVEPAVDSVETVEPAETTGPAETTEATDAAEATDRAGATVPAGLAGDVDPAEAAETAAPAEVADRAEPADAELTAPAAEPRDATETTETVEAAEPRVSAETVETAGAVEPAETFEPAETVDPDTVDSDSRVEAGWQRPQPPAEPDPALAEAVELARDAAVELAGADAVGEHQEAHVEDGSAITHYFAANQPGYRGWRWAVTVASGGAGSEVTVSETTLLPGPDALVAPTWVPWQERVRPGDLGVGDLLPTEPDDPRLVPGYLGSDDPQVRDVVHEIGLGRVRVLSRLGRDEAGDRWHGGEHGPRTDMARAAPGTCVTCGFYLQLSGSLSAIFGVCANEFAPADGAVVHAEYGCGAHSDVEADQGSVAPIAELVYDDGVDLESR